MRTWVETDRLATLLLAALGVAPLGACGGAVTTTPDTQGSGGAAGTGAGGTGGVRAGAAGTAGGGGIAAGGMGGDSISSGGSGGGGGSVTVGRYACVDVADLGGGYARCASGMIHRTARLTCPSRVPRAGTIGPDLISDAGARASSSDAGPTDAGVRLGGACRRDTDCGGPLAYCGGLDPIFNQLMPYCTTGCVQDTDCESGNICECGDPMGHCVRAACDGDGACGAGLVCGTYVINPGCPGLGYACQSPLDECSADADCPAAAQCTVLYGRRSCLGRTCAVGRPFLIDGAARVAERGEGHGWLDGAPSAAALNVSPRARASLAEAWSRIAFMEHASIAAFARFTLQLLSLGAPADLVHRANTAALDETRHAQFAFAVASAYAGTEVAPGALDLDGAFAASSLWDIVRNVIREGCVGETIAAVEAAEAAKHASDPAIRSALERVADDELAHAELAWRFVRWAVARGGPPVGRMARDELDRAAGDIARAAADEPTPADTMELLAGGVVSGELLRRVREAAVQGVVLPCARALFDDTDNTAPAPSLRVA